MNELILVTINSIAYIVLFGWYAHKVKALNTGVMLLGLWAISSLGAILYEPVNFIGHNHKITLVPYIYLFIMNIIMFYPILNFRDELTKAIKVNIKIYKYLCLLVSIICILPFFENLIYAFSHISQSGIEQLQQLMNDRYEDSKIVLAYLSRPAVICTRLLSFIGINVTSILLVLFPLVLPIRKHKWLFIGVIMANMNFMLQGFNTFARFIIFIHLVILMFASILVYRYYLIELRKKFIRYSTCIIGGIVFIFATITFSRMANWEEQRNNSISIYAYVGQYMSEAMGNFNANMWPVKKHTEMGRFKYAILKSLFRKKIDRDRSEESFYLGYYSGAFFTAVGDYYRAYGAYTTAIIIIISSILFTRLLKQHKTISITTIMLLIFYARMPLIGFLYNTYAVSADEFIGNLFLIPIVYYLEKNRSIIYIKRQKI